MYNRETGKQCQDHVLDYVTAKYTEKGVMMEQFIHIYMSFLNFNAIVSCDKKVFAEN